MTDTTPDTIAAMSVDTGSAAVEGLIKYIEKAATPSIARVHCIVVLKALAAERDQLRAQLATARNAALDEAAAVAMLAHSYHDGARKDQLALGNIGNAEHRVSSMTTSRVIAIDIRALKTNGDSEDG